MISAEHKPTLILALKGKPSGEDDAPSADEHDEMLSSATSDFIDAVHAKDADAAKDAFCQMMDLHKMAHDAGGDADDEAPESDRY